MDIKTGDTVTIRRGKQAGTQGEVIAINDSEAVLKLAGGTFSTQAVTNVKAPEVPTINANDLAAVFEAGLTMHDAIGQSAIMNLAELLDDRFPAFSFRLR